MLGNYNDYITKCRDMLIDYEKAIKGLPIAYNFEELFLILQNEIPCPSRDLISMYWSPTANLFDSINSL